jgi:hypothetical protein
MWGNDPKATSYARPPRQELLQLPNERESQSEIIGDQEIV